MTTYDFSGRVAVVTGGAQGIGQAVAAQLVASGAKVALWDMADHTEATAQALGSGTLAVGCDISDWGSVEAARVTTEAALGPVDVCENSAGIAGPIAPVIDYDPEAWTRIVEINLTGTFHVNKSLAAGMRARNYGRIVNIASIAGKEGNPNACAYSASKAGVIGFTKSLGKELADVNVSVNCVTPAAARTPIFDQMSEEHIAYMLSKIPRNRFLEVEEAAHMITWLCSAENGFTTGATFDLSGGRATY